LEKRREGIERHTDLSDLGVAVMEEFHQLVD
jgi:hypothetical protein